MFWDTNKHYLPEAFIYALTNYEDYAARLIADQKLGNYWEAESSAYNRFYDTSLALITLGRSSSEQITKAQDWLIFSQGANGCWQNSVRDTAIVLWALSGRAGRISINQSITDSSVTYCSEAGYFCIPSFDCPSSEDVGDNYFCASLSDTCCMNENILTCSEYGGEECSSDKLCIGNERKATDTEKCCTGTCEDRPQENECETNFYTCMDSCSEYQEPMSVYSCDGAQVCCRTKTTVEDSSSGLWWIWILVILILVVLAAIGYVYRDKLKLLWFQIKTKFKKDDGKSSAPLGPRPGMPPRPGFPPLRRPSHPRPPSAKMQPRNHRDKAMSETFRRLKEMSS